MPYELTINRVGALASSAGNGNGHPVLEGRDLVASFRRQANLIAEKHAFLEAEELVLGVAKDLDPDAHYAAEGIAPGDEIEPIEIFPMPKNFVPPDIRNVADHLVGLLPSKRMFCTIDGMKWILRVRASITACALDRSWRLPKLWWTFEGIPADEDPVERPTRHQAASFIATSNQMAARAIPKLHAAYRDALLEVQSGKRDDLDLRPERIWISLSDNEDRPLAEVIDAMTIEAFSFSQIAASTDANMEFARDGAQEFRSFVGDVAGDIPLNDRTVSVFSEIPALKGLICRHEDQARRQVIITGLARSSSMRGGYSSISLEQRRVEKREGYLRAASAARPLTAMLARREALALEQRLLEPA